MTERESRWLPWLAAAVLLAVFWGSLDRDLVGPGESRVARLAWEMHRSGDYLLPTFNGELSRETLTKPPLYHWLVTAAALPFDWRNFSLRLVSLGSILAGLWLVWLLGRRLCDSRTGAWAAVILASAPAFAGYGISARMDLFLALLVLAAMLFLHRALEAPEPSRRDLFLFHLTIGLAMLVKGPAGFVIPVATALFVAGPTRGRQGVRRLFPAWGIGLFLAVGLSWYLAVLLLVPPEVARSLFIDEPLNWAEGNAGGVQSRIWYYLPLLLGGLFPWSPFLVAALVAAVRKVLKERQESLLFLLCWFLGGLLLFSLGGKKAMRYLLPILPAAALLTAWYFRELARRIRVGRGALAAGVLTTLMAAALAGGLLLGLLDPESGARLLLEGRKATDRVALGIFWERITAHSGLSALLALTMFGVAAAALAALWKRRMQQAVLGYALFAWILLGIHFHTLLPVQSRLLSPRPAAEYIRSQLEPETPLLGGGDAWLRAILWYLERDIRRLPPDRLLAALDERPEAAVLILHERPLPSGAGGHRHRCRWRNPRMTITFFFPEGTSPAAPCPDDEPASAEQPDRPDPL